MLRLPKNPPAQELYSAVALFQFSEEAAKSFLPFISGDRVQVIWIAGKAVIFRLNSRRSGSPDEPVLQFRTDDNQSSTAVIPMREQAEPFVGLHLFVVVHVARLTASRVLVYQAG